MCARSWTLYGNKNIFRLKNSNNDNNKKQKQKLTNKQKLQAIGLIMDMWLQDEMFENCFANFGNHLKLRIVSHTVNQKENTKIYLSIKKQQ